MATPVQVTKYGTASVLATTTFSATDAFQQAFAYPYEGFAFGVAVAPSIADASTTSSSSSTSSSVPSATGTNSAATTTYTIVAATDPVFTPNTVNAKVGDTILFEFVSGNHSITQSTFAHPCLPVLSGADSGYLPNTQNVTPAPSFAYLVTFTSPQCKLP
jgi:plastocyanin